MTKKFLTPLQKKFNEISKKYSFKGNSAIMKKEDEEEESGLVFGNFKKNTASSGNNTSTASKPAATNTSAGQNITLSDSGGNTQNAAPASEIREGALIKSRVSAALEEKLGVPDTKKIFDKINDAEVEKNVSVAKETVSQNINSGKISKYQTEKYPYMLDAFAVMYAANNTGNKKLENNLYKLAYMEDEPNTKSADENNKTQTTNNNIKLSNNDIGTKYFENTKIIEPKFQRVYHGDTWLGAPQLDLNFGKMSKEEISNMKWIRSDELDSSEKAHIATWRWLANATSTGEMQDVVNDMITHFLDGTGTDYKNKTLTKYVAEHKVTKAYMNDFTNVFKKFLEKNRGNVKDFPYTQDFKEALKDNGVLLSTYAYKGIDTFTGLRMAIHGWTESDVDVEMFEVLPDGTYHGRLKFTFIDNFGLDADDINEFGSIAGFRSWYILQHYDKYEGKYKPFRTVVTIDYPFAGKL